MLSMRSRITLCSVSLIIVLACASFVHQCDAQSNSFREPTYYDGDQTTDEDCPSDAIVASVRPPVPNRALCESLYTMLFSTVDKQCFSGSISLLSKKTFCGMAPVSALSQSTIVCDITASGALEEPFRTHPLKREVCSQTAGAYVFHTKLPNNGQSLYIVMRVRRPPATVTHFNRERRSAFERRKRKRCGSCRSYTPNVNPDATPSSAKVVFRSKAKKHAHALRRTLRQIRGRGMAWSLLFNKGQIITRFRRVGNKVFVTTLNFREAFQKEMPKPKRR